MRVRAHQNETLDALCYRVLQNTDIVEQVLKLNPGIDAQVHLNQGQQITLPDKPATVQHKETVKLWD